MCHIAIFRRRLPFFFFFWGGFYHIFYVYPKNMSQAPKNVKKKSFSTFFQTNVQKSTQIPGEMFIGPIETKYNAITEKRVFLPYFCGHFGDF